MKIEILLGVMLPVGASRWSLLRIQRRAFGTSLTMISCLSVTTTRRREMGYRNPSKNGLQAPMQGL